MSRKRSDHDDVPTVPLTGPLLTLDVSSSAAGWSLFTPEGEPADFDVIRPPGHWPTLERIDWIVRGVRGLVTEHDPAAVLLEWADGRVHGRIRGRSAGVGLAVLGQAQGAVRQSLLGLGLPVAIVGAGEWTGGVRKERRAERIAWLVPEYGRLRHVGHDPGFDIADAIGIGFHCFARVREAELLARASNGNGGAHVLPRRSRRRSR